MRRGSRGRSAQRSQDPSVVRESVIYLETVGRLSVSKVSGEEVSSGLSDIVGSSVALTRLCLFTDNEVWQWE
jgi:hypothetical protein